MYFIVCGACNMYSCILCIHGCMLQHAHILWWRLMAKPMLFYNIFIMFLLNIKKIFDSLSLKSYGLLYNLFMNEKCHCVISTIRTY